MLKSLLSLPRHAPNGDLAQAFARAAVLGLDGVLLQSPGSLLALDFAAAIEAEEEGGRLFVECDVVSLPLPHPLYDAHPASFTIRRAHEGDRPVDPRQPFTLNGVATARLASAETFALLLPRLVEGARSLARRGVRGLLLRDADALPAERMNEVVEALRDGVPDMLLLARDPATSGFDGVVIEGAGGRPAGTPPIAELSAMMDERRMIEAAIGASALIVPEALANEREALVRRALRLCEEARSFEGERRVLSTDAADVLVLVRGDHPDMRHASQVLLTLFNRQSAVVPTPDLTQLAEFIGAEFEAFAPQDGSGEGASLDSLEVRSFIAARAAPIVIARPRTLEMGAAADRLVIEAVTPRVEGGDFPVKRIVGESVTVEATLFGDGHEQLAAELLWRAGDAEDWRRVRMEQNPNDLWRAAFPLERLGRYEYRVEGWLDRYGGFRRDFAKKLAADVAAPIDHAEGRALIEAALARATGETRDGLEAALVALRDAPADADGAALLLAPDLAALMDAADDRPHRIRSAVQAVDAERTAARFSSWYELFPRSQTDDASRHGTFDDVIARLPAVRDMGFDTLYFPPIHPIGKTNRKGPNNTLTPGPDDVGSPYAIGAPEGGHDAIHPQLGTFEDFKRLIDAAADHGLEIALDFAIQCSPDHPWLREHPGWFAWRPDGSMKYAENPPKKYQDIVNVDFYGPNAVPGLWVALRDVVLLWVSHGVKTFRVDNPHTKPLPFWEWMIGDVRARHPEVIFLAEAFTRPSMMYRLAKIGFSQSYTYFTWRDGKQELTDYIEELTTTAPKDFYRPHFFVNTPDINPLFLQGSGRPGFRIRAVLAATLSGLFGVYSGFELCEAAALPGKEEYLDSEKYIVKPRDWQAPGNIIADITLLNRLRRGHPALQTHLNTRFYAAHNDSIIWYGKPAPDQSHMVMVMVSLDPHGPQEATFEVPLWEFGLPDDGSVAVVDLAEGHRFRWHGKTQHIRLDPDQPYRIWRIAPGEDA